MSIPNETEFHTRLGAKWDEASDLPVVLCYDDMDSEYRYLTEGCGLLDMSARGRLCLLGDDRVGFLHGQVTNHVKRLRIGEGCYAALLNAKGKMDSDLNIWMLDEEILLDFEPGLGGKIMERLNRYIIAEDVEVADIAEEYRLAVLCGPKVRSVLEQVSSAFNPPASAQCIRRVASDRWGESYMATLGLGRREVFHLYLPTDSFFELMDRLVCVARETGAGGCVGQKAFECLRMELGVPRFGVEMDDSNLPLETGIEDRAVSSNKGCYIGQEILARMRTYGQAAKKLCGFHLPPDLDVPLPSGCPIFQGDKQVGVLRSSVYSLGLKRLIAMGYLKKQYLGGDAVFEVRVSDRSIPILRVDLPFMA